MYRACETKAQTLKKIDMSLLQAAPLLGLGTSYGMKKIKSGQDPHVVALANCQSRKCAINNWSTENSGGGAVRVRIQ